MNRIQCLVVDDEPLAIDVVENYIGHLDTLALAGRCSNAVEALLFLQRTKVDLLFLDIQMPKLTGIDFLKTLSHPPRVILTTAYRDYALEGFELNVLDYLLKPVSFERFLSAVNKYHAATAMQIHSPDKPVQVMPGDPFIYVKADKKMVKVFLREILYIESLKDYVRIKTVERDIITYQRITYLEEKLPDDQFLRIHRSYIVAINKIRSFNAITVDIGTAAIPIGRLYKTEVMKMLDVEG